MSSPYVAGVVAVLLQADPRMSAAKVEVLVRALEDQLTRGLGRVASLSGGGATKARANFSAYGAAKTAVVRLVAANAGTAGSSETEIDASAYVRSGVRCSSVR